MPDPTPTVHWRPGRKVGRTLYIHQHGAETGLLVGMVDTPDLAQQVCDAMNAQQTPDVPDAAVRAVAEQLLADYDTEHNADHLHWRDFGPQARKLIEIAAPHIRPTGPTP